VTVAELDDRTILDVVSSLVHGSPLARGYIRTYAAGRITYDLSRREAYSYGRHFPLFRFVPKSGRNPALFVINGDNGRGGGGGWRVSRTPEHQESARRRIAETGIASIILPFSALDGAGININTIRPLHVRPDTWETITHERATLAEVPQSRRTRSVRLEGPSQSLYGYNPRLWLDVPVSPDADGIYRWTEGVHRLGDALFTAVRNGRRGRYLSSFDYNERPPLYFLCEVPARGVPATVEAAVDSLAPRAVHAARLAGKPVERQGDVFFIGTSLTTETLANRGATFGRFTLWSRSATPKPGEVTYRPPNRERSKRTLARERKYRRELWRDTFRDRLHAATVAHVPDSARRDENRELWRAMSERHTLERSALTVPADSDLSTACTRCGAEPGEPCREIPGTTAGTVYQCTGNRRFSLDYRQSSERTELRRKTGEHSTDRTLPVTPRGYRRRCAKIRAERETAIQRAREDLRLAVFGRTPRGYGSCGRPYGRSELQYRQWRNVQVVKSARKNLQRALEPVGETRQYARDSYRSRYGGNATGAYVQAADTARRRFRPETVSDTDTARANREAVRRHLMIYGTSHTATDVARVGSAVYVRGTVRHAVDLETNRRGGPDHRPLTLSPDIWYLSVRNTVPRQNRRNRARTVS